MSRIIKILKYALVIVVTGVISLALLSAILEPQVSRLFIQKVNRSLDTRAEVGRVSFSLLKGFPGASVELNNLRVYSPGNINDTLLSAGEVSVSLKITALIRRQYIIDRLTIDKGVVHIVQDIDGNTNLNIFRKEGKEDTSAVTIDLNNIRINNSRLIFTSRSQRIDADLEVNNAVNRLSFSPDIKKFDINSTVTINHLSSNDFSLPSLNDRVKATAVITVEKEMVTIKSAELKTGESSVTASGSFNSLNSLISLDFTVDPSPISFLASLAGGGKEGKLNDFSPGGVLSAEGSVKGVWTRGNKPPINARFKIEKGAFKIPGKETSVTSISATGLLNLDPDNPAPTLSLEIDPLSANFAGNTLNGSLSLMNIKRPVVDIKLAGIVDASAISLFIDEPGFRASGKIRTGLRLFGTLPANGKYSFKDILSLNRSINLNLGSVDIDYPSAGLGFYQVKGNIMVAENIWFDGLTFSSGGSEMAMNGRISGFNNWITDHGETLSLTAGVWSNRFSSATIENIVKSSREKERDPGREKLFSGLNVNLDLKLDSLVVNNFRASMFSGEVTYNNNLVNVSAFSFNSLSGRMEGNCAVARLSTGHYLGKGWFDISAIDINETFGVFNNFRQSYIKDENLRGRLSGNLSITSELDSKLVPLPATMEVTGNYLISDGELLNFEPVMALSKFVDLSELKDIRFSELKNDLLIRNRTIVIPSMDIRSSAFDISLSGSHSFDGLYTYHLKLLLSDILSRKAKARNNDIDEFGVIENDGLGRTSLHLKIEGDREGSKVSYDMKNMKVDLKRDMQEEKGTLKSILREEYGWYAGDSIPVTKKEETRKFRITWEEADSIKAEEQATEEKILPLKSIFRKKKKGGEELTDY